jgi:UDP-GlcNAc:undecaprenyl-phosphate/decaprenyl-phosphate GlcNAc-1-phosphate transferase
MNIKDLISVFAFANAAFLIMLFIMPALKKIALKINLTDVPNGRKLHHSAVPLIGGIAVALTGVTLSVFPHIYKGIMPEQMVFLFVSLAMFLVGVVDDKFDLNAKYKLFLQMFFTYVVADSGTRITSLQGFMGIHEIPLIAQYLITFLIICGVMNAFNLMDGIDGMLGALGVIGFSMLVVFAFITNNIASATLFSVLVGALVGFLKFNLSKEKIFMGDAGSLLIGSLLICSSIFLIEHSSSNKYQPTIIHCVVGFFALPVLDSLRVYLGRMKQGKSPFRADKSHVHHLLLLLGLSHKQITAVVSIITILILLSTVLLNSFVSLTCSIFVIVVLYSIFGFLLNLNKKVNIWILKLKQLEQ